jgi:hypothetical protein
VQPKEPKKEAVRWYEKRPGLPNDQEMLFFVLLTLTSVATSLSELKEWAVGVQRASRRWVRPRCPSTGR